jgi:hypothetical protein
MPAERYVMQARAAFFKSHGQFFNHRKAMKPQSASCLNMF